jgi:TRAP-type C4-dicarboxylate transport system permease small subunit
MGTLARTVGGLVAIMRVLSVVALVGLVLVLLLAIAVRELGAFGGTITWAEEAERFLFIWLVFLASPVALDRGEHILIDVLVRLLPGRPALLGAVLVRLLVLGFLGVMVHAGIDLVARTGNQFSAALGLPMSVVHAVLPLSAALMALQVGLLLLGDCRALARGEDRPVAWRTRVDG